MRVTYDEAQDVLYFSLFERPALSTEVAPGVIVRTDSSGEFVGIAIMAISERLQRVEEPA